MRQCPFCGADVSSSKELFCHKCYNQIRSEVDGEIYSFPSGVASYDALVAVYASIFQPNGSRRFIEAKNLLITQLNKGDNFSVLSVGLKQIAEDALAWAKKLCYWEVFFDDNGKPQDLSTAARPDIYKDIEETANLDLGRGFNKAIEEIRITIGKEEYAVRAKNLCYGCSININGEPKTDQDSIDSIRGHAKLIESNEPMFFISAPSYDIKSGNRIIEYAVGRAIKYQLDSKGVRAFWWENFNKDINILGRATDKKIGSLRIAAKIAFGLAFSSVFIGVAFDTQNFADNKNCKYEIERFHEFKVEPSKAKEYVSFDEVQDDVKDAAKITHSLIGKLPRKRTIRLLTLSKNYEGLKNITFSDAIMQTLNGDEEINVDCSACEKTVEAYVKKALGSIFDILQHNYKNKYKSLKTKNSFDSDDEFRRWFCTITGDVGSFHEVLNAPSNYNCSYAVLDEYGADVHKQIEFFVERVNHWDRGDKRAKRKIQLNMVATTTNDKYISDKKLVKAVYRDSPDACGFLFDNDPTHYQICEINYEDTKRHITIADYKFSTYTLDGGKMCVVEDINALDSGIVGTIKFKANDGKERVFNFAVTLSRQIVKIPKKVAHTQGRLYDSVKRKIHCPYCAEPLPYFNRKIKRLAKEQGVKCQGNAFEQSRFGNRPGMILCDQQNEKSSHAFVLPDNYEKSKSAFITMMGLSDAGKSVFISKLFGVEKDVIEFAGDTSSELAPGSVVVESVKLSDKYIQYALSPYVSKVSCYYPEAVDSPTGVPDSDLWEKRYLIHDYSNPNAGIFTHYCSIPYANFVEKTLIKVGETLHYAPLILNLKTHDGLENYFSFYDLPGEEIEDIAASVKTKIDELKKQAVNDKTAKNALKHIMLLQNSNGIILMINGGTKAEAKSKGVKDICDILSKFLKRKKYETENDKTTSKKNYKRVKNVAIAVVLCQFDRIEQEFDFDNIVRTLAPLEDADFYRQSEMEKYIDACSVEIEKYLNRNGYEQLIGMIDNFVFHKYFAVSAIGHINSIKEDSATAGRNDNYTRFVSNPRGIDNVLIWLAYQMGMID